MKCAIVSGSTVNTFYVSSGDFEHARAVKIDLLDSLIQNRALSPGETVSGFLLVIYPRSVEVKRFVGKFRVTIGDTSGVEYAQEIETPTKNGGVGGLGLTLDGTMDISSYPIWLYQDNHNYWR